MSQVQGIGVTVDVNAQPAADGLASVGGMTDGVQLSFEGLNTTLASSAGMFDDLTASSDGLASAEDAVSGAGYAADDALATLEETTGGVTLATDTATPSVDALGVSLDGVTTAALPARDALGRFTTGAGESGAAADSAKSSTDGFGSSIEGFGKKVEGLGKNFAIWGIVISGIAGLMGITAAQTDQALTIVDETLGISGKAADDFRKKIEDLSIKTGVSVDSMLPYLDQMAGAWGKLPNFVDMVTLALNLQVVGAGDLGSITQFLTGTMSSYGLTTQTQANKLADYIDKAHILSGVALPDLLSAQTALTPTAVQMGESYQEGTSIIATFANTLGGAGKVSTDQIQILTQLQKPSKQLAELIQDAGYASGDAMVSNLGLAGTLVRLNTEAGKNNQTIGDFISRAGPHQLAYAIVNDKAGALATTEGKLSNSTGTLTNDLKDHTTGVNKTWFEWQKFQAVLAAFMDDAGQNLLPIFANIIGGALIPLVGHLQDLATWFEKLSPSVQKTVGIIAGIIVVAGPVLIFIGGLITAIGGIAGTIGLIVGPIAGLIGGLGTMGLGLTAAEAAAVPFGVAIAGVLGPILLIIGAIALLAFGAYELYTHWGQVMQYLKDIGVFEIVKSAIKDISDKAAPLIKTLGDAFKDAGKQMAPMGKALQDLYTQSKPALEFVGKLIAGVLLFVGVIVGALASGIFKGLIDGLGVLIPAAINVVIDIFWVIIDVLKVVFGVFNDLWTVIVDIFQGKWGKLWGDVEKIFTDFAKNVTVLILHLVMAVVDIIVGLAKTIWAIIKGFVEGFVDFFTWLYNELIGHSIIPDMVNGIITFIVFLEAGVMKIINGLVKSIKDVWNTIHTDAVGIWNTLSTDIQGVISGMVKAIEGLISGIGIKLPHIDVTMKSQQILGGPSIPYPSFDVKWYGSGGIFDAPSLIGVGEKGTEVVAPLSDLQDRLGLKGSGSIDKMDLSIYLDGKVIGKVAGAQIVKQLRVYGNANRA